MVTTTATQDNYMYGDLFTKRVTEGSPQLYAKASDPVNKPDHYTHGGIETFDYIKAKLTPEEYKGYLKGNALKYLSRAPYKGEETQDYAKTRVYVDLLSGLDY